MSAGDQAGWRFDRTSNGNGPASASSLDLAPILYVAGALLCVIAGAMIVPLLVDLAGDGRDWMAFGISSALTLFFGVMLILMNQAGEVRLTLRQTFLLTSLSYILVAAFSALPFMVSVQPLGPADAVFEAMSGLSTTGATVLTDLEGAPRGILMWRALLQWLGGIGIIAVGIAILPFLSVGGMQLFRSESSDRSDKVVPRVADLAHSISLIYLGLTVACIAALRAGGMEMFDAVCHAMTAVSTGGFSTSSRSIANWEEPVIHWTLILFMIGGALPFVRMISFVKGDVAAIWKDSQVRRFLAILAATSIALGLWRGTTGDVGVHDAIRHATFNVTSIVTTTGYATEDYSEWGAAMVALFFMLTMIGGCTGSTAGGMKVFRFEILFMVLRVQLDRAFSPNRVMPLRYGGKPVNTEIMLSVMSYLFVFFALVLIFGVVVAAQGLDFLTAMSGAATALANVGPGLGPVIGPTGSYAPLPDAAKWSLSLAMMLGRLEFFTVLVLLNPAFWRR